MQLMVQKAYAPCLARRAESTHCERQVTDAIQAAADDIGATSMRMISRGYHDAGLMAQAQILTLS